MRGLIDPERPLNIIDVGSRGGIQDRWKTLSKLVPFQFTGFEPVADECERLNLDSPAQERYIPVALGAINSLKDFTITRAPGNCGLYAPDPIFAKRFNRVRDYDIISTESFEVATLDHVADEYQLGDLDFIKSDTEGGDLDVMIGAEKSLQSCIGVEIEVWFNQVYQGQPLFADIDVYLRQAGFSLFDVARANFPKRTEDQYFGYSKGQLVAGDAVYFRDLLKDEHAPLFWEPAKFVKSLATIMNFGYHDYCLELVQAARDRGTLDVKTSDELERIILKVGSKPLPKIRGQHRLANLFKSLSFHLSLKEVDRLGN